MRLTKLIAGRPHGAEGRSEEHLTGYYCRGKFEATALVERLYQYEEIGLEPEDIAKVLGNILDEIENLQDVSGWELNTVQGVLEIIRKHMNNGWITKERDDNGTQS